MTPSNAFELGVIVMMIGAVTMSVTMICAWVLASRFSGWWVLGLIFVGWLLYPFFVVRNWPVARGNAMCMIAGLTLMMVGATMMAIWVPAR